MDKQDINTTQVPRRQVTVRSRAGATARIIQNIQLKFSSLFIEQPTLIYVRQGRKIIEWQEGSCVAESGQAVVIGGVSLDITNCLDIFPCYDAIWISWDNSLIEEFNTSQQLLPEEPVLVCSITALQSGFRKAINALLDGEQIPLDIARL